MLYLSRPQEKYKMIYMLILTDASLSTSLVYVYTIAHKTLSFAIAFISAFSIWTNCLVRKSFCAAVMYICYLRRPFKITIPFYIRSHKLWVHLWRHLELRRTVICRKMLRHCRRHKRRQFYMEAVVDISRSLI